MHLAPVLSQLGTARVLLVTRPTRMRLSSHAADLRRESGVEAAPARPPRAPPAAETIGGVALTRAGGQL